MKNILMINFTPMLNVNCDNHQNIVFNLDQNSIITYTKTLKPFQISLKRLGQLLGVWMMQKFGVQKGINTFLCSNIQFAKRRIKCLRQFKFPSSHLVVDAFLRTLHVKLLFRQILENLYMRLQPIHVPLLHQETSSMLFLHKNFWRDAFFRQAHSAVYPFLLKVLRLTWGASFFTVLPIDSITCNTCIQYKPYKAKEAS